MVWIIPLFLLGLLCGAMVNYLADTLPIKRTLSAPFCHVCQTPQRVFNYFIFPRKCEFCGARRIPRTFIVEIMFSFLTVYLWLFPSQRLNFWLGLLLWVYFGVVIIIDLEHRLILHPVSIFGLFLGLGSGIWMHGLISTLLGGALGYLIMFALYYIGILLFNKIIKRKPSQFEQPLGDEPPVEEALGYGDVNLSGVVGLLLGWPGIVAGITITIFLAGGFSLLYLLFMLVSKKYQAYMSIPYGPFIVLGAAFLLFFVK
jgi:leader peptidase (prepilin peptidase)/N-methyltransferase